MKVENWCNLTVVAAAADVSLHELAEMMREYDVEQIVIVHEAGTLITPIGIVTDRDLALRSLLSETDASGLVAGDIMSRQLLTVLASEEVDSALAEMRAHKVHRAPVVDEDGALVGILLMRDALASMANLVVECLARRGREPADEVDDPMPAAEPVGRTDRPGGVVTDIARYRDDRVAFDFRRRMQGTS